MIRAKIVVVGALVLGLAGCGEDELVLNDQEFTVVAVLGDRGVLRVGG